MQWVPWLMKSYNPNLKLGTSLYPLPYHLPMSRNTHHATPGEDQCHRVQKVVKSPLVCSAVFVATEPSFMVCQEKLANTASSAVPT
jgi:hypothetical protein